MKEEDSLNEDLNEVNDSNLPFGGKAPRLSRKNVIRRKNAEMKQQQLESRWIESHMNAAKRRLRDFMGFEVQNSGIPKGVKPFLRIFLLPNASYHRVYSTIQQAILNYHFTAEYSASQSPETTSLVKTSAALTNYPFTNINALASSVEHLLEDEFKFSPLCSKNIPKVVSLGLNVVLDIIKDSYQQNPSICIRSLESLKNLLTGLKPESLKYEPPSMIERFFDLILWLISMSHASLVRNYSYTSHFYDDFHKQVLELSISCLITLSIARGDTSKILNCIKTLLIDCSFSKNTNVSAATTTFDNGSYYQSIFNIEIPEIMVLFKKNVCSFLLGRLNIPEWYTIGFPVNALCETFQLQYTFHKKCLNKHSVDFKAKLKCATSFAFDGQFLLLYRCNRIYRIGTGYNGTSVGQEVFSSLIDLSNSKEFTGKSGKCCSNTCWIGYIDGDLFLQPHSWSLNQLMQLDAKKLTLISTIPVICDYSSEFLKTESPLKSATLATTDGDYLILMSAIGDDCCFMIRELKPHKVSLDGKALSIKEKKKVTFLLSSEITIRLSTVSVLFCGHSIHNLHIPAKNLINSECDHMGVPFSSCKSYLSLNMKLLDTNNLIEYKNVSSIVTGKDFALMLTEQGKVYYSGNAQSLGIRHVYSYGKWFMLSIPKPVRIVQISAGHEGHHALILSEDGTLFFVGTSQRGEDGELAPRPCHRFNKPSRVKKFAKLDANAIPVSISCNHGTSAIVTKSGELYLFGKDSFHCNSKGQVMLSSNEFTVSSVALGKAHMLILTSGGMVITSGFSNKGQCGLGQMASSSGGTCSGQPTQLTKKQISSASLDEQPAASCTASLKSSSSTKYLGHLFVYGKTRICPQCSHCTEFGSKCTNIREREAKKFVDLEIVCGCGDGNSGCIYCGICSGCSKDVPFCKRFEPSDYEDVFESKAETELIDDDPIERNSSNSAAKFIKDSSLDLNRFDVHRRLASKLLANTTTIPSPQSGEVSESELDPASLRIVSVSPTILPLSTTETIVQIAAGLHHSVLLTDNGEVYTFGSNQFGQLGTGDFNNRYTPTRVKIDLVTKGCITQIATGSNHTVLLTSLGEVLTFGNNQQGQLGRVYYNSCKLEYSWVAFPAKMDNVGPEFGRIATSISSTGDFTYVKYDEMLLSSNLLTSAKLVADKNNLILIPPQRVRHATSRNFDKLFDEKSCKHLYCTTEQNGSNDKREPKTVFNNLNPNILIISRSNGACSMLNPSVASKMTKFLSTLFDVNNQLNFDMYSSVYLDKYYNNLWTFNSHQDEFARFNLIELEASSKMAKVYEERQSLANQQQHQSQQQQQQQAIVVNFPNSLFNLNQLNTLNYSATHFMQNLPCALQPDITVPLVDNCGLRQSPQQMGIELLSFLTSLTYSHLLGISVNDKLEQLNCLTHTFLPEEYLSFCRFEDFGGGWGYPPRSVEAIRFSADTDIILGGIGLYGGRGEYTVQLRLFDIGYEGSDLEREGDLLSETDNIHYECLPRQKYQIFLDDPILIQANRWYVIWAAISGPSSDCGSSGQPFICTADQVMFHFKNSKHSNNGTDVTSGQIPVLFYKPVKSNDFQFPPNNAAANFSLLSLDEEGLPFYISKDFVLKINSACINSLCDLLRHIWSLIKSLFHTDKLTEIFAEDDDKLEDKLTSLISEIKRQIYVACFLLELIRAYVQIFLPANEMEANCIHRKSVVNSPLSMQIQKYLHYDHDEYQRIAQAFFAISTLLSSILSSPIEVSSLVMQRINSDDYKHHIKRKLFSLNKLNNFFIDECHQTFLSCTYAFYPTNTLKWRSLCDLLSGSAGQSECCDNESNLFSNKQLYLLSAVIKAFCVPTLRLVSFFPTLKSSVTESCEESTAAAAAANEELSSISDFTDLTCQIISKKTTELYKYDDHYQDFTSQFIFDNLLTILVKPIKHSIECSQFSKKFDNLNLETEPFSSDYRQFANYCSDNNSNGCEVPSLNLSVGNTPSAISYSTSTSSSSSSSLESNSLGDENIKENTDAGFSFQSANTAVMQENSLLENLVSSKCYRIDSKKTYSKRLISGACDLMTKFISELDACSIGLINNAFSNDTSTFGEATEFVTPSRFCRRSSTKNWDTGSGAPEAICFSVNKASIYISGVRVYSFSIGQLKYQLQLLDQACDNENRNAKNGNFTWRTLSSVSGILAVDDNQNSDFCELRFERPVLINPNVKYAIVFKNFSISSFSGDMGLPQVRGDDETLFTFMDCSLSKNGTNLSRGQIPQILYYNLDSKRPTEMRPNSSSRNPPRQNFNSQIAFNSIVSMFRTTIAKAKELLTSSNALIADYTSSTNIGLSSPSKQVPHGNYIRNDAHLFELLFSLFESVFFKKFIPNFILYLHNILNDLSLSYEIVVLLSSVIPLIADLSKMINTYFSYFNISHSNPTTSSHYLIVESDHPYKAASVTSFLVRFPSSVQWMAIEFDSKSQTAQEEDYLEIYMPRESFRQFSADAKSSCDFTSDPSSSTFKNLINIYPRFSGKNFTCDFVNNPFMKNLSQQNKLSTSCFYVPGNELVFMLKTSSDYAHTGDDSSYYGFKAQVVGYEQPMSASYKEAVNETSSIEMNKEAMFQYVKLLIQNFENDLVYLFGLCINTMLNSSSQNVIADLTSKADDLLLQRETWLQSFDMQKDIDHAREIFSENELLLGKGLAFEQSLTMKTLLNFDFPIGSVNSFLDDFICLKPESSGLRLALWFQSESFISPNCCIVNTLRSVDFCCGPCIQFLESNFLNSTRKLCSRCHYQFFVKTIPQMPDCKNACVGQRVYIKIVTRDQHEEIAYDPNASVVVNIRLVSPFEEGEDVDQMSDFDLLPLKQKSSHYCKSALLDVISINPYQPTVKDKCRFHAITMMKAYEAYSFEELRYHTHATFKKNTTLESISVKSFENGYYLATWTPSSSGCYKAQLVIDGECNDVSHLINVNDAEMKNVSSRFVASPNVPLIRATSGDDSQCTKIKLNQSDFEVVPGTKGEVIRPKIRHCIRKFICHDSAGLRIRALPSLQSEQIGIVAINGLLTIIDQFENDDGIWVRLSNESIQAYCSSGMATETYAPQTLTLGEFASSTNLKQSLTFTMRAEAWTLQYNRHFNRTLLVPIDSEDDLPSISSRILPDQKQKYESFSIPGWFQVVNCAQDGHLIRNSPNLLEVSVIIGIVQLNEIVNGVEALQNEFGLWIRLSQDSLQTHIGDLIDKSSFFESDIDGWMLAQSINGLTFLRSARHLSLHVADDSLTLHYLEPLSSNRYSLPEPNDNCCTAPSKHAISNSAAQCVRAIFAAFVWHEGILHDVLTAASYLKFNAEITKDYIKEETRKCASENETPKRRNKSDNHRHGKRSNRSQKAVFRHSVEVSQLLSCWSSDVNSNMNDIALNATLIENNNNNNNNANNNNNNDPEADLNTIAAEATGVSTPQDELVQIPEILINLLKIWDFVSSECLKIFTTFNAQNKDSEAANVDEMVASNDGNADLSCETAKACDNCGSRLQLIQELIPFGINIDASNAFRNCDCMKDRLSRKDGPSSKGEALISNLGSCKSSARKYSKITNIQQLYSALKSSSLYLLSLVPSNSTSLTGITAYEDSDLIDKNLLTSCEEAFTQLEIEHFKVADSSCFQSLQHLGIQKSVYEQKLAEEKLSDLAILEAEEDYQQLLSPEDFDHLKAEGGTGLIGSVKLEEKLVSLEARKSSFKFYRSISVGMNDSHSDGHRKSSYRQYMHYSGKHIKSSETLDSSASGDKFNMPFLCKPSTRLINLIQQCVNSSGDKTLSTDKTDGEVCLFSMQSALFCRDVFRFIFSCYNIELYNLVLKGTICASGYRALALKALNWLLMNVSSPVSLHDILWIFVCSLLPKCELDLIDENIEESSCKDEEKPCQGSVVLDSVVGAIASKMDVCQHPFSNMAIAGESAECWISEGLHQFIRSVSNLLPLFPMGSSLQQMAIRCFGIDFKPKDHIFLHECKVFSHISTILTRSSADEQLNLLHQEYNAEKSDNSDKDNQQYSLLDLSTDATLRFELKTSSRQSMVNSLVDNSTETFWESGNEDRTRVKHISMIKSKDEAVNNPLDTSHIKFICIYIDNSRDTEYKVSQVVFKIMMEKCDALKYCHDISNNLNLFSGSNEIEFEKVKTLEVDPKFCGWLHCELSLSQSREIISSFKYLRIELIGPYQSLRVRQLKALSVANFTEMSNHFAHYARDHRKVVTGVDSAHVQTANCEGETLRVFRLLSSQVFGKLLSSEAQNNEKRSSFYQNSNVYNQNNENDLREHMVGILFSQSGKLSELQKQVCSHIVNEIHCESGKVREEWEFCLSSDDGIDSYLRHDVAPSRKFSVSRNEEVIPSDAYCFELLSLVQALSGSSVGCIYLAKQNDLFFDILTLLHTSSDRVKRQVLSLIRRVISQIKPSVFTQLFGLNELPNLSDIFAKTHRSLSSANSMQGSFHQEEDDKTVLFHFGALDIFLAGIAKSLTVTTKIKGSGSRFQVMHSMSSIFRNTANSFKQWWLKGSMNRNISHSIIALLKDMVNGSFGKDWAEVARISLIEKILNLTLLSETSRQPEQCIQTPTLWMALASLCVLDEKDAEMLSSSNLSKFHDQANGNNSHLYCDNHDDGETIALVQCNVCGNLCADCDRFLHLNTRTRSHKRHIFKEKFDSIKVDIHEGCSRAKFFWALTVADSKLLKAMVEFRVGNLKSGTVKNDSDNVVVVNESSNLFLASEQCRFCGAEDANDMLGLGYVCDNEDCQLFAGDSCKNVLDCGHFCHGILNEAKCLPCLHGCSGNLRQDGDDMCMVCFSESLFAGPCIQLSCSHVFHFRCIQTVLEKRWSGGRISFNFSQCPICKEAIDHPSLSSLLEPIKVLYEDVKRKALMRLEYEGLHKCKAIIDPNGRFFNDPASFALEKYSYYLCFKCDKAYFGGEARCDADLDASDHFNPEELICGSCSDVAQAQICPKHGTDFLEYKCRFCCSVAVYFCFGSTHFCNACHEDFQRLVVLKEYPQCPVGPRGLPLEGDECPLHVVHPPTGEEFALGCGICRNAHTF